MNETTLSERWLKTEARLEQAFFRAQWALGAGVATAGALQLVGIALYTQGRWDWALGFWLTSPLVQWAMTLSALREYRSDCAQAVLTFYAGEARQG